MATAEGQAVAVLNGLYAADIPNISVAFVPGALVPVASVLVSAVTTTVPALQDVWSCKFPRMSWSVSGES